MISYIEFMERLLKLNKEVNTYLIKLIREKNLSITSMELLLLMKIGSSSENITPKEVAKKSSGLFQHLKFLLNSLENKRLISLKSKGIDYDTSIIDIQQKGTEVNKIFVNKSNIPENILKNLEELEIFVNKSLR